MDSLPRLIDDRCAAWELEITGEAFGGGTHSYVVPVRRADGSSAILKLTVRDEENLAEPTALWHYGGDGAVKLYAYDPASGAMLLEHATPGEPMVRQDDTPFDAPHAEGRPDNVRRIDLACALYRRLWRIPRVAPAEFPPIPRVADRVAAWRQDLPRLVGVVDDAELVAHALRLCEEFSTPDGPEGIANRDTHLGNIVSARREPWLLIDPKPLLGERAFDAGYLLLVQAESASTVAEVDAMVARTAHGLGVAPERARGWAFLRSMEIVLWASPDRSAIVGRHRETARLLGSSSAR
ncbi:MAG TPA: aminoglycoside phosphotransferase family protein [Stackebrandtia sp.]|uniref:aminoglycoside phosphotransferase family protein n=1 Tax=Stackebrandtia sp. TaxID=2023065 RepID=UPI002D582315|nr:aminoglycoside phosphotransferase family protein [Stackebrandtia sp.]HZE41117.1 aminoglycoside phosphotransferase family protein [Stackebrandtia sp.]